jgi:hypothetical protein
MVISQCHIPNCQWHSDCLKVQNPNEVNKLYLKCHPHCLQKLGSEEEVMTWATWGVIVRIGMVPLYCALISSTGKSDLSL